jgi:NADPH-dependent ferric siderophore reductase
MLPKKYRGTQRMSNAPNVVRVRHELRRRLLTVANVQKLAPKMLRITFKGDELQGFTSLGFDDHVKLFFSASDAAPIMRDFTPRRFDVQARELAIDFYLHAEGAATTWAAQAAPGQTLTIGGPRGSSIISLEGIDSHVLIGDETAIPAIGRRLEELSPSTRALVVIEAETECVQNLSSSAQVEIIWVPRDLRYDGAGQQLIEKLRTLEFPDGRCFVWAATETRAARAIRRYLIDERGFNKSWVKAAAYWQRGASAVHEVIED